MTLTPPNSLVRGVRLLCLDAGNTLIFLDHGRLAAWATARGVPLDADALVRAEGAAKRRQELGSLIDPEWPHRHLPGALGWGRMVGTMLHVAGVAEELVTGWLPSLWGEHVRLNLWSRVPPGTREALLEVRACGIKVAVVSNSEGMLDELFSALDLRDVIDLLLDSGKLGVEKPDPRIFRMALEAFGVAPEHALHLGDSIATDVVGARAAGVPVALIDPFDHCLDRATDVPRVEGVVAVARALAEECRRLPP